MRAIIDGGDGVYRKVCDIAHAEALAFVEGRGINVETFFVAQKDWKTCACSGEPDESWTMSQQFLDLVRFVQAHAKLRVLECERLPEPGFASWLHISSEAEGRPTGATIGVDTKLMGDWFKTSAMPMVCQMLRSVLHELGHYRLSPHLVDRAKPDGFSADASDEEEEKAWVYAFIFLGILAGAYARECRKPEHNRDDVPKVYL